MEIEEKRIYELISEQTTLTDSDLGVLDKSGYTQAKKFTMLNLYNYIASKLPMVTSFLGLSDTPGTYTGQSGKIVVVNNTEDGLEFLEFPESNVLFYANSGDFPNTGAVDFLYVAKNSGGLFIWDGASYAILNPPATEKNISTNDVVFPADSLTDFAGFKATFDNAELKIIADADTSGDKPFEITKSDGATYIVQVLGDGTIQFNGTTQVTGANHFFNVLSGGIVVNAFDNNSYNYVLRLQQAAPGYAEIFNVRGNGNILMEMLPTSDAGLAVNTLFTQTATQLGGSGTTKVICIK